MSMNIKNPETHKLARELAEATGESVTEAVTTAVRERLERVRRPDREALRKKLVAISKRSAAAMTEPYKSRNWDEYLYDERGLPK